MLPVDRFQIERADAARPSFVLEDNSSSIHLGLVCDHVHQSSDRDLHEGFETAAFLDALQVADDDRSCLMFFRQVKHASTRLMKKVVDVILAFLP